VSGGRAVSAGELWRRLIAVVMVSHDESRRAIRAATGLPAGRFRVLRRLGDGPRALGELAELIGSDAPATTVTVNDLEQRGMVVRRPHPDDRRIKLVSLTAAGRGMLIRGRRILDAVPVAFVGVARSDLAALARILDTLDGARPAGGALAEPQADD
jgi:DNA-binding MarR family transcriptional regulator